jgi:hypothetical protein
VTSFGGTPQYGPPAQQGRHGQPTGQQTDQPQYGQPQYGQPQYGQSRHGQQEYGQQFGQVSGQPQYGQQQAYLPPAPQGHPQQAPPQDHPQHAAQQHYQQPPQQFQQQPYGQQPPYEAPWGLTPQSAQTDQRSQARSAAVRQMAIGGVIALVGIVLTIVTYAAASDGGHYVVAYGPAIFGVIAFVKGLVGYLKA